MRKKMPKARSVRITSGKSPLKATLVKPRTTNRAAVLLHGLCVDKDEYSNLYRDLADMLADRGVASIRFDFPGHGSRAKKWKDFSIARQTAEAVDAIDWIVAEVLGLNSRVALLGTSFGAPPAIFSAIERANYVDRVALLSPVLDYKATFFDTVTPWGRDFFGRDRISDARREGSLDLDGTVLPRRIFEEMIVIDPLEALGRVEASVLIIHGSEDCMVPVGPARAAARISGVHYNEIRHMDHGPFDARDADENGKRSLALKSKILKELTSFMSGD